MSWLTQLFSRRRVYTDLSDEIREHLREKVEELMAGGLPRQQAEETARREFGNAALIEEHGREVWHWAVLESLFADLKYAVRRLKSSPGFTLVAVATLAIGIGGNTAIFTLIHAVMLRSLPVRDPQQLLRLSGDEPDCCVISGLQREWGIYSYPLYQDLRDHTPQFEELAAFKASPNRIGVRRQGDSRPAQSFLSEYVSGNYFRMFGVGAGVGRMLSPEDDRPGATPVAVMSYRAWKRAYSQDHSVVGSTFVIDAMPVTVVGVAPEAFYGDTLREHPPDFWLPLNDEPLLSGSNSLLKNPGEHWLYCIGRLRSGVAIQSLQAQLTVELQQWLKSPAGATTVAAEAAQDPSKSHIVLTAGNAGMAVMRNVYGDGLKLLLAICGLVLLLACANLANLLLARGAATRQKTAVRLALGARRTRVLRQFLTESLLLALMGGAVGLWVAFLATRSMVRFALGQGGYLPVNLAPSLPVLAFTLILSLLTGIIFGVAPAWIASHSDPLDALRGASRSTGDQNSVRKSLVVVQMVISTVLLVSAGMLTRSLINLEKQELGFEPRARLLVRVNPALAGYNQDRLSGLYQQLQQQLPQIPGVTSASYAQYTPYSGNNWSGPIFFPVQSPKTTSDYHFASWNRVGPHYFETVGTPLLRGRAIDERDTPSSPHVAVVNQEFAKEFFKNEDPMGKHFGMTQDTSTNYEIIGVVADVKYANADQPFYPMFFLPFLQLTPYQQDTFKSADLRSNYLNAIVVKMTGSPQSIEPQVRKSLASIDPNLAVISISSLGDEVADSFSGQRLLAVLTGLFALLALLLAAIGIYGVTAYTVARRTNEIGIRIALGATHSNVTSLVFRGIFTQVALGLAIGLPGAIAGAHLLASQLYNTTSYDPLILSIAVVVLSISALLAGLLPARRAARVDPLRALRIE
ncbi:MAG: ADOP family duplicated permease [Actinomycetota bacterium]